MKTSLNCICFVVIGGHFLNIILSIDNKPTIHNQHWSSNWKRTQVTTKEKYFFRWRPFFFLILRLIPYFDSVAPALIGFRMSNKIYIQMLML